MIYKRISEEEAFRLLKIYEAVKRGEARFADIDLGLFYVKRENGYTAIDNISGECFFEDFKTWEGVKAFLNGEELEVCRVIDEMTV